MTSWEVLRYVHKIGHPIPGIVEEREELHFSHGIPLGNLTLRTSSEYCAVLSYNRLTEDFSGFHQDLIPPIGTQVQAVVFNFVDGILHLSAKPSDLAEEQIESWKAFYRYLDTLELGKVVRGTVRSSQPFGLFVDIGEPYRGLVDIGVGKLDGTPALPLDRSGWPQEGEEIQCRVRYIRLHDMQLGLDWLPEAG